MLMLEKAQLFNGCGPLTYYLLKGLLKIPVAATRSRKIIQH